MRFSYGPRIPGNNSSIFFLCFGPPVIFVLSTSPVVEKVVNDEPTSHKPVAVIVITAGLELQDDVVQSIDNYLMPLNVRNIFFLVNRIFLHRS